MRLGHSGGVARVTRPDIAFACGEKHVGVHVGRRRALFWRELVEWLGKYAVHHRQPTSLLCLPMYALQAASKAAEPEPEAEAPKPKAGTGFFGFGTGKVGTVLTPVAHKAMCQTRRCVMLCVAGVPDARTCTTMCT